MWRRQVARWGPAFESTLASEALPTRYKIDPQGTKILTQEDNWRRQKIREAMEIRAFQPALNHDQSYHLPVVYMVILSHDRRWSCDR